MVNWIVNLDILVKREILEFEIFARYIFSITVHLWGDNSFLEVFYCF